MRSEILQSEEIKLYEYNTFKPPLEDVIVHYNHNHDPNNGQFTTGPISVSGSSDLSKKKKRTKGHRIKKETKKIYKTNEQALEDRDFKYVNEHKDQFTSKEMDELMKRIQTEERMSKFTKDRSSKAKVKEILKSPEMKIVSALALTTLGYATYQYITGVTATPKRLQDKTVPYSKQFKKDMTTGAKNAITRKIKKKIPI